MARHPANVVLRHIRELATAQPLRDQPDAQLLDRFVQQRDEAAFEALVRRHGPMVFSVCRRLLRDGPDAEDAFQATFLVLARKAASIRRGEQLAGWLHGVARRVAARARVEAVKRLDREAAAEPRPSPDAATEVGTRELCALLDEELHRLPERYRAPFVL